MSQASRPTSRIGARVAQARARLTRLDPAEAYERLARGAVLVDIRPQQQRAAEGHIPCALAVERNVLEWRFDPTDAAALPIASADLEVIVICQEGYTSSLAAQALLDLGIHRATDVVGGFVAWRSAGHPTAWEGVGALRDPRTGVA